MPNLTDKVSNIEKRVNALEKNQTQKDENIIPLIIKQYQTLKISPKYSQTTVYASATQFVSGTKEQVALDLTTNANYIAIGTGSSATVGSSLDFEQFRKITFSGDNYDNVMVIDGIIESEEANGALYTNCALILRGTSSLLSGNILTGKTNINIYKSADKTLTISSEITIVEV